MEPEHRCKSGMDGGLRAAVLFSPPLHLRMDDFLSNRWGPPHGELIAILRVRSRLADFSLPLLSEMEIPDRYGDFQGSGHGPPMRRSWMKPRLSDVEWMAFAAIFALPRSYFGHHSHRKFSRIKTNILMVLHAIHRPTKVRSSHRRYPGAARQ